MTRRGMGVGGLDESVMGAGSRLLHRWDKREFKWRGKAEMRDARRASIIRSAFIVSFGIGLPALSAAPIDKVDKCTHLPRVPPRKKTDDFG